MDKLSLFISLAVTALYAAFILTGKMSLSSSVLVGGIFVALILAEIAGIRLGDRLRPIWLLVFIHGHDDCVLHFQGQAVRVRAHGDQ
jgi:hypothetical protein